MPVGNFSLWQLAGFASCMFYRCIVTTEWVDRVDTPYPLLERTQSEGRAKAHWKDAHTERQPPVIEHFRQPIAYALDIGHSTPQSYKSAVYVFEPPIPLYFPLPFISITASCCSAKTSRTRSLDLGDTECLLS